MGLYMDFKSYLEEQKLAPATIKTYISKVDLYTTTYGEVEDLDTIISNVGKEPTISKMKSMSIALSKYLQYKGKDKEKLSKHIKKLNADFQKDKDERMAEMVLPTLKDIKDEMNVLYEKSDWRSFVILYLMTTFQVRNMDLIATVVQSKRFTNDTDNFFVLGKSKVTWIRNKYKTSDNYGTKTHVITSVKFMNAIRQIGYVLKPNDNIDRIIKKSTVNLCSITEGTIAKIVLLENNTMNAIKKVSKNRGTNVDTLVNSYNIT
jgi:hypothetical protein